MQLRAWFSWTAGLCIIAGIAFAGWGPVLFQAFAGLGMADLPVPVVSDATAMTVWSGIAFARLLGVVLLALGLLLWSLRDAIRPEAQGRVAGTLVAALTLVLLMAGGQQVAIWNSLAGWVALGAVSCLLLGVAVVYRRDPDPAHGG